MIRMNSRGGSKLKADVILIAFCLVLSAVLYFCISKGTESGERAVVRINGETVSEYSLDADGTYALNGGTNVLIIKNGAAHMDYADCPDKLCMHQGEISRTGQCITCLPNRITVTIEGGTSEVDSVVG